MRKLLFFVVALVFFLPTSKGQIVGTDVFLQGRYVEAGLRQNFAFGVPVSPTTYHAMDVSGSVVPTAPLALIYDVGLDGWFAGTPNALGDFVLPGFPSEGWSLQVGASEYRNEYSGGFGVPGAITGYSNAGGIARAQWSGSISSVSVRTEARLDTSATSVLMTVKLVNTGASATAPLYYMRYCDPDNLSYHSGGTTTQNTIVYQSDALGRAFVNASTTTPYTSNFGLGAIDTRARVCVIPGLTPTSTAAAIYTTITSGTGSAAVSYYAVGTGSFSDQGICIVFSLGSLAPGDSTEFTYAYIFNGVPGFDSTFAVPCTGTPTTGSVTVNTTTACLTTGVTLNLSSYTGVSGLAFQWQSSADSSLWTNISGATSTTYSFTGLVSTTYYRCVVTCSLSGLSSITAGKKVTYTGACPCLHTPGTTITSVTTACSSMFITLSNTGYTASSGVALQWQSSPDSTVWTDIGGATAVPFTFSGLTDTAYYRLKTTCIATGLALFSNVKRINYLSYCPCSGTPAGGIATASTTYCSSCSLTVTAAGVSSGPDITYQWERSVTGVSGWSNIPGATTSSFTHTPVNTLYYRCKTRCTPSGLQAYSSTVLVTVPYFIIEDSVKTITDTSCSDQKFFVRVSATPFSSSSLLKLKTYFGDGTSIVSPITWFDYVNVPHTYAYAGYYTVKQVLYYDTVAQDSITFTYHHPPCEMVRLKFYADFNHNCIKDATEYFSKVALNVKVDSNGIPIDTASATSGLYYRVYGPPGTIYTFSIVNSPVYAVCPTSGILTDTVGATGSFTNPTQYFGIDCSSPDFDFTQYSVVGVDPRWLFVFVLVSNKLCQPEDATELYRFSPKFRSFGPFVSMTAPSATTEHSIEWFKPDFSDYNSAYNFCPRARVVPDPGIALVVGDTVHTSYLVTPKIGDADSSNNYLERVDTVVASYDPNVIEVLPRGCFDHDTTLQFTVHFENLGNDTARNVYVLDTISGNLDFRSIEVLAASHEMDIFASQEAGYNIVKFDFPNINLADSSADHLNDGMFVYKIRTKPGLAVGEHIFSRVGIYFDYNEVVMTNTVQNTKGCPVTTTVSELPGRQVLLYPNPATDKLTIRVSDAVFTSLSITNAIGQEMISKAVNGSELSVDVRALPAGVYQVTLRGTEGSEVRKFVKW